LRNTSGEHDRGEALERAVKRAGITAPAPTFKPVCVVCSLSMLDPSWRRPAYVVRPGFYGLLVDPSALEGSSSRDQALRSRN